MNREYYYLATPYTRFPGGIDAAFRAACEQAAVLIRAGVAVFSPIAHTHPIAMETGLDPLDLPLWLHVDSPMMACAKALIMCRLPGWEESRGMEHERRFFRSHGRPVWYMDPGVVPLVLQTDPKQAEYAAGRKAWQSAIPVAS